MKQRTLAMMTGFEQYTRKTRRAIFLEEMEQVVPWRKLCALVEPHYPKPGNGRPPVGVERMLRIYFLQQWFNLSDPAVEEALYDSTVMRQFVGIDLGCEPVPDETTVCKFRHLLEEHQLGERILGQVNLHLQAQGVRITTGTIVDATILHAPTSTKNREQQRDPEMHQTKKGKQWYFGMKAHVGVDSKTKIIHTAVATAANVADSAVLPDRFTLPTWDASSSCLRMCHSRHQPRLGEECFSATKASVTKDRATPAGYFGFAYSALASFRMGMSGSQLLPFQKGQPAFQKERETPSLSLRFRSVQARRGLANAARTKSNSIRVRSNC